VRFERTTVRGAKVRCEGARVRGRGATHASPRPRRLKPALYGESRCVRSTVCPAGPPVHATDGTVRDASDRRILCACAGVADLLAHESRRAAGSACSPSHRNPSRASGLFVPATRAPPAGALSCEWCECFGASGAVAFPCEPRMKQSGAGTPPPRTSACRNVSSPALR
jgi:hypothetical protein